MPRKASNFFDAFSDNLDDFEDLLVIGIDFGTTHSGVSWATFDDFQAHQTNVITNWPDTGREEGKVPSEIYYDDGHTLWGFGIPPEIEPLRWFKLLLLKHEDLSPELKQSEYVLRGSRMLKESGKSAVEVVADYLCKIWKHTLATLIKTRGEFVIDALRLHVVITVPATWPGYARQKITEAATKAGILAFRPGGKTTLSLAPEPEAAALSTLCEPGYSVKEGEVYVICDAGGGTVDLISYQVDGVKPISLKEVAEGTGGLFGGIFIDEKFELICKRRLGRRWNHLSQAGIKEIMKGEWEIGIKPQFKTGNPSKEYIVSIPAEAFCGISLDDTTSIPMIQKGRIHFQEKHLKVAFTDAFAGIEKLIDGQISEIKRANKSVSGIILVGGLGGSPFLYEQLRSSYAPAQTSVLQSAGIKPRTSICRGAVYKGFLDQSTRNSLSETSLMAIDAPVIITSRIARASFGIRVSTAYDERKHLIMDKAWDALEGRWVVTNQIDWYIKRGDNILRTGPIRKSYYRIYDKDPGAIISFSIYQCDNMLPSTRIDHTVELLCNLTCKLDVPYSDLADFRLATGGLGKRISFDIQMTPSGAVAEFELYLDERRQGGHNVEISFQ